MQTLTLNLKIKPEFDKAQATHPHATVNKSHLGENPTTLVRILKDNDFRNANQTRQTYL